MEIVLTIKDLKMSYGSKEVLKGINLEVYKGEIIGYIGANGAGKSTTIKAILGLINQYTGSIEILGEKIDVNSVNYKSKIGYVPESADLYDSLTAEEYLTFVGELYGMSHEEIDQKARRLMELFGIGEVYQTRISSYSKGMRQKTLIIGSLLHNPDILFFDEPINGMDANSVMVFKELMTQLAKDGKTIFYSSHIMDVVERISSRIILLNEGTVAADGTFEELKKSSKEGSLEGVFNNLTGFHAQNEIANDFLSVMKGE